MRSRTRGSRERGAALLVALVLVMLVTAMVEALLIVPGLELDRARSTVAKERALAIADAGVRTACVWLSANGSKLDSLLPQPTAGSPPTCVYTSGYWSTPAAGVATYAGPIPLAAPSFAWAPANGPFAPPYNGLRFGDPIMARGEVAFRIAPLGGGYYQVDAEGHAFGTTASGARPARFVARVRAVVYRDLAKGTGLGAFVLGGGSADRLGNGNAKLVSTSNQSGKIGVNGNDLSGGSAAPGLVLPPATSFDYASVAPYSQSAQGAPPQVGGASSGQPQLSYVDALVQRARELPPQAPGTGNYTSTTYAGKPVNVGTDDSLGGTVPSIGLTYIQVTPGMTVLGPVATSTAAPGEAGGITIIDVESTPAAPVTFAMGNWAGVPSGLVDFPGNHDYRGTVILYVHGGGPVNILDPPASGLTNALVIADKSGNGSPEVQGGLLHYDSANVTTALGQLPAATYFAAYTVLQ